MEVIQTPRDRLMDEMMRLLHFPILGVFVQVKRQTLHHWNIVFFGKSKTLWEGGYFRAKMFFPRGYPNLPPSITFMQDMQHPNVFQRAKSMSLRIFENWQPRTSVIEILSVALETLHYPILAHSVNQAASLQYREWLKGSKDNLDLDWAKTVRQTVADSQRFIDKSLVRNPKTDEDLLMLSRVEYEEN